MLVLAGSAHGPVLRLDGVEPVVEFEDGEPRVGAGGAITAAATGLGEIDAAVGAPAAVAGRA